MKARETALLLGIAGALAVWIVWGAVDPIPLIQDEYSYVLQSRIFAAFHWTAAAPPIPQFFQQAHVLTTPVVASKFAPGTALLMSIGSMLGAPALVPLLLTGLTAALIFLLVRRIANAWAGIFAALVWMSDPISLRFHAGYFSETVSGVLWLVAWWALLQWRETHARRWMIALAAAIGWGAITRPLTMLAFAIPVGILVLRDTARSRAWRDLAAGIATGVAILLIIPLWSRMTTGDWRLTPQTLYTRQYIPFDKPGFGVDRTPPTERLEPPQLQVYREFFGEHVGYTPARVPRAAFDRLRQMAHDEWWNARIVLVPFLVAGLFALSGEMVFALCCAATLVVAYLFYGHSYEWTLYYVEALPVLAALTGIGLAAILTRSAAKGKYRFRYLNPSVASLLALLAVVEIRDARAYHTRMAAWDVAFRRALQDLPAKRAVIFVHYDSTARTHANVVANSSNLADEPIWIVHNLGERNRELMRYAADRVPIAFYENGGRFDLERSALPPPVR